MKRSEWAKPTSNDEAFRRACGRNRYNATRSTVALRRRVFYLLPMLGGVEPARGGLASLARRLGVSRSTICRDISVLRMAGMLKGRMSEGHLAALAKVGALKN